jgi:hypothetical protein
MAVSVVLRNYSGETLASLPCAYMPLTSVADREMYPILGHVDPYGRTIYNRLQMQTLVEELDRIRAAGSDLDAERLAVIDGLRELCVKGLHRPHTLLWFLGD